MKELLCAIFFSVSFSLAIAPQAAATIHAPVRVAQGELPGAAAFMLIRRGGHPYFRSMAANTLAWNTPSQQFITRRFAAALLLESAPQDGCIHAHENLPRLPACFPR